MQIFLSWSGDRSKYIANAFRDWLPNVIQAVEPFISTQDIEKGIRGEYVISQKLESCNVGIVVLTPENQQAPWILFESGALSKIATAHLCTFLYDLSYSEVKPPLASFQHTTFKLRDKPELHKNELLEMVRTINSKMVAERRLTVARLEASFETWWPQFEKAIQAVPELTKEQLPPERAETDKIDEVLLLLRAITSGSLLPERRSNVINLSTQTINPEFNTTSHMDSRVDAVVRLIGKERQIPLAIIGDLPAANTALARGLLSTVKDESGNDIAKLSKKGKGYLSEISNDPI